MIPACSIAFLAACDPTLQTDPLFKDVARTPPLTKAASIEYLVKNDRPLAVWIEEMARACDEYGCI